MNRKVKMIDVCGKQTLGYIAKCLSIFNEGNKEILLRAYGCNINKGVEIAQILKSNVGASIQRSLLDEIAFKDFKIPYIEIPVQMDGNYLKRRDYRDKESISGDFYNGFISYSTYHVIFAWLLHRYKKISIKDFFNRILLEISYNDGEIRYQKINLSSKDNKEKVKEISNMIDAALHRCGLILPSNWKEVARKLSLHDDVILGVDTNVLYNCTVSEHLLPSLSLVEINEYIHTPSWVLLVVPATVMFELEEAANIRKEGGDLRYEGRCAYRALQEIVELTNNIDITGISLLIVDEATTNIDNKNYLQKINENICKVGMTLDNLKNIIPTHMQKGKTSEFSFGGNFTPKTSSGDMIIRNQFKKFLRQIDFHKGTYFLTADKSNSVLAMAEGLNPIFIARDSTRNVLRNPNLLKGSIQDKSWILEHPIPIGNVLYEMAVSFGEISVEYENKFAHLKADLRGRYLDHWTHRNLQINKPDLKKLVTDYQGDIHLSHCANFWEGLISKFVDTDGILNSQVLDVFNQKSGSINREKRHHIK